jgi:hypothetical protein
MDTNGARLLRRRLESHEHWVRAAAVQCGDQPRADPDAERLVDFTQAVRWYGDGLCKRLIRGRWESGSGELGVKLAEASGSSTHTGAAALESDRAA